ncbi:MAG: RNA polymerase sigma factor [Planctomycetota bacterium]
MNLGGDQGHSRCKQPDRPFRLLDAALSHHGSEAQLQIDDTWIRSHYASIHRSAWILTGNAADAEDLAQETFVVAITNQHRFRSESTPKTWLRGILIRLVKRHQRQHVRTARRIVSYIRNKPADAVNDPAVLLAQESWRSSIWFEVSKLPTPQRLAIALRFGEQLTNQEIALVMRCSLGTVKSRIHHGLRRLHVVGDPDFAPPSNSRSVPSAPAGLINCQDP